MTIGWRSLVVPTRSLAKAHLEIDPGFRLQRRSRDCLQFWYSAVVLFFWNPS